MFLIKKLVKLIFVKKKSLKILIFGLLLFAQTLAAQRMYVLDNLSKIGWIDPKVDCDFHEICQINTISGPTDISFHPNGKLYVTNFEGQLYTLDTTNCQPTLIGSFANNANEFFNALTSDANGLIFCAGSRLATFNPVTNIFKDLGALPTFGWSSGDLTFRDGKLYLSTQNNTILAVNGDNPSKSKVVFPLNLPPDSDVFGIVTAANGCNSQVTYATVTTTMGEHFIYEVDFKAESVTKVCQTDRGMLGATTSQEFLVSECDSTDINPPVDPTFAIYLPNIFSPDDDGKNDFFTAYVDLTAAPIIEFLQIYDRWGGLAFEKKEFPPNDDLLGWNGSWANSGKKVTNGVYVVKCKIRFSNGSFLIKSADLTVIRSK
jgi:CHU_C Type IX secretion signal domain